MSTINISNTSIPKFVFDSKVYGLEIIDRISEKFYTSPIDNDKFDTMPKSRYPYIEISNMKLWKSFSIDKFIIIVKDYNSSDPCVLVTKNDDGISINFGYSDGVNADLCEEYHYTEEDTFGEQNVLQIFNTDDHRNCCIKWALMVMNLFVECNNFFDKKEIVIGGGKNKKKKSLTSYTFNIKKFGSEFIGVNSYDSIVIKNEYKMFDPHNKIRNIFPFDKVMARIPFSCTDSIVSFDKINNHKIALKIYVNDKINFYDKKYSQQSWGIGRLCEIEYDPIKNTFSDCIFSMYYTGETEEEEKSDTDCALHAIGILFDVLKYMVFNTKKVENNKIYFNSPIKSLDKKGCENKYRNNVEMCSTIYEIDGQMIKQVEDAAISEAHRQTKPCEYAFTVRGHYRHLKDGRLIWVNSYIKNKDKEFKPKNYIDKKKEG